MIDIKDCRTILDDASDLLIKGSECVEIVKEITDKNADTYATLEQMITDMKVASGQLKSAKEIFDTIYDTMIVACMMSVYAGKIEESGHWNEEDPDADSYPHINDYLRMAFEYDIPKTKNGENDTDVTQYQLYQIMKEKYYIDNKYDDSEIPIYENVDTLLPLPINAIIDEAITQLIKYRECLYKLNRVCQLVNKEDMSDLTDRYTDIDNSIKHIRLTPHIIRVALMAAVYAGNIEASGWGFKDEFGADSLTHLDEYLRIAEQYEFPIDNDGKIATDCVHTDISNIVHATYSSKNNKESDTNDSE